MNVTAQRVKEQRKKLGITQQQLAFETGMSVAGIQSIETGRAKPNVVSIGKLALRFQCTADYLIGKSDEPTFLPLGGIENVKKILDEMTHEERNELVKLIIDYTKTPKKTKGDQ